MEVVANQHPIGCIIVCTMFVAQTWNSWDASVVLDPVGWCFAGGAVPIAGGQPLLVSTPSVSRILVFSARAPKAGWDPGKSAMMQQAGISGFGVS